MIKILHVAAIAALIGSAGYAYSIKYETLYQAEKVAKLKSAAQREREAVAVLKAEWALLNRPDRLQEIADRHLDLQPMSVHQLARLSDLPAKAPKTDAIGRKLESLGLLEPTSTPRDRRPADARTPTAPPTRTPSR